MQRIYQGATVCFVIFSALVVWGPLNLEYYTKLGPGAGFFPLWLGVTKGGSRWPGLSPTHPGIAEATDHLTG